METTLPEKDESYCRPITPVPHDWLTDDLLPPPVAPHPCAGVVRPGNPPRIFFWLDNPPEPPTVASARIDTAFGAGVAILLALPRAGEISMACIERSSEAFAALEAGRFIALLVHRKQLAAAYDVQLGGPCGGAFADEWSHWADDPPPEGEATFAEKWRAASEQAVILRDLRAWSWEMLANQVSDEQTGMTLSPEARLRVGWVMRFRECASMAQLLILAATTLDIRWTGGEPQAEVRDFVDLVGGGNLSVGSLLEYVTDMFQGSRETGGDLCRYDEHLQSLRHEDPKIEQQYRALLDRGVLLWSLSPAVTQEGTRLPWISFQDACIKYLTIRPREFPSWFDPRDYWRRVADPLSFALGELIAGNDVPADLTPESPYWRTFPAMEGLAEVNASADALLEEAQAGKQWSIPRGAMFELSVGPFVQFQAYEIGRCVMFVARTRRSEFVQMALLLHRRSLNWPSLTNPRGNKPVDRIQATMKLLLAGLVRDFWVVEQREHVFRSAKRARTGTPSTRRGPVTVYLPRIRYASTANLGRCENELGQTARRAHHVAAHLRRAPGASEHQLTLAARFGFMVPPGYTFVRPHERGDGEKAVVYRSRSALQSLYDAVSEWSAKDDVPEWFAFERDVRRVIESFGLEIRHVTASPDDDRGIDVYATSSAGRDEVRWLIHGKAYAPSEKIRPRLVRALVDAQVRYPPGTRAMLITTSACTPLSKVLAAQHQIRVIDGFELSRLLAAL